MKIICIEDDKIDFELIKKSIMEIYPDIGVEYFRYLNDFLESNAEYDLIITDLRLPDVYGPNVIKRIREVTGKPIIVLSGVGGKDLPQGITRTIKNFGATIFLSKNQNGFSLLPDAIGQFV